MCHWQEPLERYSLCQWRGRELAATSRSAATSELPIVGAPAAGGCYTKGCYNKPPNPTFCSSLGPWTQGGTHGDTLGHGAGYEFSLGVREQLYLKIQTKKNDRLNFLTGRRQRIVVNCGCKVNIGPKDWKEGVGRRTQQSYWSRNQREYKETSWEPKPSRESRRRKGKLRLKDALKPWRGSCLHAAGQWKVSNKQTEKQRNRLFLKS